MRNDTRRSSRNFSTGRRRAVRALGGIASFAVLGCTRGAQGQAPKETGLSYEAFSRVNPGFSRDLLWPCLSRRFRVSFRKCNS